MNRLLALCTASVAFAGFAAGQNAFNILTTSLPNGALQTPYNATVVTDSAAPLAAQPNGCFLFTGVFPPGLVLTVSGSNCVISGTPTQNGTFSFSLRARNTVGGLSQVQPFTITIGAAGPFQFLTNIAPNGAVGQSYFTTLPTNSPVNLSQCFVPAGILPPGLFFDVSATSCIISGIPAQAGTYPFLAQAVNANQQVSQTQGFTIVISGTGGGGAFQFLTSTTPDGVLGQSYLTSLQTNSQFNLQQCSLAAVISPGALPPGLGLGVAGTTCTISGIPTQLGVFNFLLQASNVQGQLSEIRQYRIEVCTGVCTGTGFRITTTSVPPGSVGTTYQPGGIDFFFQASGGVSLFWSVIGGSLPPGLSLASNGLLFGIPTAAGSFVFDVQVTDTQLQLRDVRQFVMTITSGVLRIRERTLPFGIQGQAYSAQLNADGGSPPYTWSIGVTNARGLTIDPSTGLITGTPQNAGTFDFPVTVRDATGRIETHIFQLFIATPLSVLTTSLPNGATNEPYDQTLQAGGGQSPYAWDIVSGALPQGLTLERATGRITGRPTAEGRFAFTVRVTDAGSRNATRDLSILIGQAVQITTTSLPDGAVNQPYSQTLSATGGQGPYTWALASGSLPSGLNLSTGGIISGTPAVAGSSTFTVRVTDSQGSTAERTFQINVVNPVSITTTTAADGVRGVAYSQPFGATGGTPPYTWTVTGGSLPPGLNLNSSTGLVTGTPTSAGTFGFTLQVRDTAGQTASRAFLITIIEPLTIVTSNLSAGTQGAAYSQTLAAQGGNPPYTWSVISGALPQGLNLNGSTGAITGTPAASGSTTFTVQVTDSRGQTSSRVFTINVALPALPAANVNVGGGTQPPVNLTLGSAFPIEITGEVTVGFASPFGNDRSVRFSNGDTRASFRIPAGQTNAIFTPATLALMPGSTAGTITLTSSFFAGGQNITPTPAPTRQIVIDAAPPVITLVQLQQVAGGLNVVVQGISNTRELMSMNLRFAAGTGSTLAISEFTVQLATAAANYFRTPASEDTGGQFRIDLPVAVQGDPTGVVSVTATVTNSRGTSNAVSPR